MNKNNYSSKQSLKAGTNSSYTITDGNKESGLGFNSKDEADDYIKDRLEKGQDPMGLSTDYDKLADYLLNN